MKNSTTYIADFAEVARAYCSWCEASHSEHVEMQAAYWLSRLNAQALMLPKGTLENSEGTPDLPHQALADVKANLAKFFGWYYRVVFNPDYTLTEEPVMGDIGDDLFDTYKDIRAGLMLYDRGDTKGALWFWSAMHRGHWGHHAVNAISALHCLAISKEN